MAFTAEDEMNIGSSSIETEVIIEVNSDFAGEITPEMKELGVISLEKIFDMGDTVMYLARLENAPADVLEKLQEISDINSAEYNQMAITTDAVATPKKEILLPMLIVVSIVAVVVIKTIF